MRELLVLPLMLAVAACAATGPTAGRTSGRAESSISSAVLPTPRPEDAKVRPAAPTPVPRPERPSLPPFDLAQLGGATESSVVALLGAPDEIRDQSPGKVWIYNHSGCSIEVYLFPSVDVGSMAVLGTAMLPDTLADAERVRCRRNLARRTAKAQ